jgi:hypothetical protein
MDACVCVCGGGSLWPNTITKHPIQCRGSGHNESWFQMFSILELTEHKIRFDLFFILIGRLEQVLVVEQHRKNNERLKF